MTAKFNGGDVNAVLRLVGSLSDDGDVQLSILTLALSVACRSCGAPRERAVEVLNECFDSDPVLTLLDAWESRGH
jgi:hypothetical protein